jgi:hypothetical protein
MRMLNMTRPDKDKNGRCIVSEAIPPGGSFVVGKEGNEIKMTPEIKNTPVKSK